MMGSGFDTDHAEKVLPLASRGKTVDLDAWDAKWKAEAREEAIAREDVQITFWRKKAQRAEELRNRYLLAYGQLEDLGLTGDLVDPAESTLTALGEGWPGPAIIKKDGMEQVAFWSKGFHQSPSKSSSEAHREGGVLGP